MKLTDWLDILQNSAIWVALVAVAVSLLAVMAGLGRRREWLDRGHVRAVPGSEPAPHGAVGVRVDVAAGLRDALEQVGDNAARNLVRIRFALQPGLAVRADEFAFGVVLRNLLTHAIGQSRDGAVLVAAARFGARVRITVSDDGAGVGRAEQEGALREAERLAALQGWTFALDLRSEQGTTAVLLLPSAEAARVAAAGDAADGWASVQRPEAVAQTS